MSHQYIPNPAKIQLKKGGISDIVEAVESVGCRYFIVCAEGE